MSSYSGSLWLYLVKYLVSDMPIAGHDSFVVCFVLLPHPTSEIKSVLVMCNTNPCTISWLLFQIKVGGGGGVRTYLAVPRGLWSWGRNLDQLGVPDHLSCPNLALILNQQNCLSGDVAPQQTICFVYKTIGSHAGNSFALPQNETIRVIPKTKF